MRTRLSLSALGALCLLGLTACAASTVAGSGSSGTDSGGAGSTGGSGGSGGSGGDGAGGAGGSSTASSSSASSSSASASSSTSVSSSVSASSSASGTGGGGPTLCGNGQIDPGEACDGSDFGGKDCTSFGLGGGSLKCNSFCGIVVATCTPKENCNDSKDNDQDGDFDCDDSECLLAASCADSCTPPKQVTIPVFEFSSTQGRPSVHAASCSITSGSEIVYQFIAPTTDQLTVHLNSFGGDMSLSLRSACGDDTSEIACVNTSPSGGQDSETLVIDAKQGTTYFVMVDTVGAGGESFDLSIQVPFPETSCTDLADDDSDGYVDCDDPTACQGFFECMPGSSPTGEPCFQPGDCKANKNDPVCLPDFKGFPGNYCSEFCDLATPDCAGDAVCAQIGLSKNGVCLDGCVDDGDCRAGYTCQDKGYPSKVCMVPPETSCDDGTDNDSNGLLDCEDPSCQALPDCVPGVKAPGQPCSLSNECFSGSNDPLCISSTNPGWPGGYCSEVCDTALDDCVGNSQCVNELNFPSGHGQCLHVCLTKADCRTGYVCLDVGLPKKVCTF